MQRTRQTPLSALRRRVRCLEFGYKELLAKYAELRGALRLIAEDAAWHQRRMREDLGALETKFSAELSGRDAVLNELQAARSNTFRRLEALEKKPGLVQDAPRRFKT